MDPIPDTAYNSSNPILVNLKVKMLDGRTFYLAVLKDISITKLKDEIAVESTIAPESQRLVCKGKILKDDQRLCDYDLAEDPIIHLVERLAHSSQSRNSNLIGDENENLSSTHRAFQRVLPGSTNSSFFSSTVAVPVGENGIPDITRVVTSVLNSLNPGRSRSFEVHGMPSGMDRAREAGVEVRLQTSRGTPAMFSRPRAHPLPPSHPLPHVFNSIPTDIPLLQPTFPADPHSTFPTSQQIGELSNQLRSVSSGLPRAGSSQSDLSELENLPAQLQEVGEFFSGQLQQLVVGYASDLRRELALGSVQRDSIRVLRLFRAGNILQRLLRMLAQIVDSFQSFAARPPLTTAGNVGFPTLFPSNPPSQAQGASFHSEQPTEHRPLPREQGAYVYHRVGSRAAERGNPAGPGRPAGSTPFPQSPAFNIPESPAEAALIRGLADFHQLLAESYGSRRGRTESENEEEATGMLFGVVPMPSEQEGSAMQQGIDLNMAPVQEAEELSLFPAGSERGRSGAGEGTENVRVHSDADGSHYVEVDLPMSVLFSRNSDNDALEELSEQLGQAMFSALNHSTAIAVQDTISDLHPHSLHTPPRVAVSPPAGPPPPTNEEEETFYDTTDNSETLNPVPSVPLGLGLTLDPLSAPQRRRRTPRVHRRTAPTLPPGPTPLSIGDLFGEGGASQAVPGGGGIREMMAQLVQGLGTEGEGATDRPGPQVDDFSWQEGLSPEERSVWTAQMARDSSVQRQMSSQRPFSELYRSSMLGRRARSMQDELRQSTLRSVRRPGDALRSFADALSRDARLAGQRLPTVSGQHLASVPGLPEAYVDVLCDDLAQRLTTDPDAAAAGHHRFRAAAQALLQKAAQSKP